MLKAFVMKMRSFDNIPEVHSSHSHFSTPAVSPNMNIPHQLVGAPLGFSVALECHIEAHPAALTYWTRGAGHMLHEGPKFNIREQVEIQKFTR